MAILGVIRQLKEQETELHAPALASSGFGMFNSWKRQARTTARDVFDGLEDKLKFNKVTSVELEGLHTYLKAYAYKTGAGYTLLITDTAEELSYEDQKGLLTNLLLPSNALKTIFDAPGEYKRTKVDAVLEKIEDVKGTVVEIIGKTVERGEKLEALLDKTEHLKVQSDEFYKTSKAMNSWCPSCSIM